MGQLLVYMQMYAVRLIVVQEVTVFFVCMLGLFAVTMGGDGGVLNCGED